MKTFVNSLSILILLISGINLQLTEEEKEKLYKKVTKRISFGEIRGKNQPLNSVYRRDEISYEPSKIKEIIDKNKFPQSYNFIDEEKPDVHIKDQKSCGACWSFASTTALAYRFHKKGIKVNLSPQYPLSCYIKNCSAGDYLINSQFNLAKNGTVTEECLPYSSASGNSIEECPTTCKDGSDFQLYYSKNSYSTSDNYEQDNYYDIVTVIMDQLINYGPVASSINCYSDLYSLKGGESCFQTIYNYDGVSRSVGSHAIVIVGYGYENSKYYWIIQNSWGEGFCNGGFAKIEFAQIGIEKVGFSEPYIPDNSTEKQIPIKFTPSDDCKLRFSSGSTDIENSFEMKFKNTKSSDSNFYYQCGLEPLKNSNEGICSYDANSIYNEKGYYTYNDYLSLQKNNLLQFDFSSFQNQQFYYYGADYIDPLYGEDYYISEEGSKIILYFEALSEDDDQFVSLIYPNKKSTTPLSNCKIINTNDNDIPLVVYCDLTNSEINYFDSSLPLAYSVLCGSKEPTSALVHKLDKSNYPLYRVKKLVIPDDQYLTEDSEFIMIADIEGSVSGVGYNNNTFGALIDIKNSGKSNIKFLHCITPRSSSQKTNVELNCYIYLDNSDLRNLKCTTNNVYLYPLFYPKKTNNPYEVRINDNVEYVNENKYNPPTRIHVSQHSLIKVSYYSIFIILVLLLF
jgi:C1A family cysteine protease